MPLRGGPAIAATVAAGYSLYEAFDVGDIVSKGLANVYPEGNPADLEMKKKELTAAIVREARVTGLPLGTVSKMFLEEIKTNANQPWAARMQMAPMVIETAAREGYVKGTSPEAATTSLVGMFHQLGAFTPTEIEALGPKLAFFASKDPNPLQMMTRSSGYHTAIGTKLMGIPAEQDIAAQVVLDRTGVGGKSGTWLREMVRRAAAPAHDKNFAKNMVKLENWGLMDEAGKPTWMTDGHYDEQKLLHILSGHLKDMPIEARSGELKSIFGERGSGAVALMTDEKMLKQYDELLAESKAVMANTQWWSQQNATNPMQKMKGAMVDAQIAALRAGQILTPLATGAAGAAASSLGWAAGILPEPGSAGERRGESMGAWGLAGGVFGAGVGLLGGPPGVVGGAVLGTAIGAEVGYLVGTFKMLDDAAKGASSALGLIWKYGPGTGGRDEIKGEKHSMNFIPPPQNRQPIVLTANMTMDSNTVAKIVEDKIAERNELPDSASSANGVAYPNINDWNPSGN